jgi:hypothetical protein
MSHLHENDGSNDEAYNEYVRSDGMWKIIDSKINAKILDWFNTRARLKIRKHGGLLTTNEALKLVMTEDRQAIIDYVAQELQEHGHHLLADSFSDEKTRKDSLNVIESMIRDMESPD